jgi:hypothetical protein
MKITPTTIAVVSFQPRSVPYMVFVGVAGYLKRMNKSCEATAGKSYCEGIVLSRRASTSAFFGMI